MKERKSVVMLPTEKANIYLNANGILSIDHKKFWQNDVCQPQHLYITDDSEIKEGDWYIVSNILKKCESINQYREEKHNKNRYIMDYLGNEDNDFWCKKIIATTNPELSKNPYEFLGLKHKSIPAKIPTDFIQAYISSYNEGKPIEEVDIIVYKFSTHNELKLRKDGTIIISKVVEETMTHSEIREKLLKLNPQIDENSEYTNPFLYKDIAKWYRELGNNSMDKVEQKFTREDMMKALSAEYDNWLNGGERINPEQWLSKNYPE